MKKTRFITTTLSLSALLAATGGAFASVSCSNKYIDGLFFTIRGKDLAVTFCDRGASIYSIKYKNRYITYHPHDKEEFIRNDYYYGKTLGRVAGRIPNGILELDGKEYHLDVNEVTDKKNNTLHGGTNGFASRDFERTVTESADHYNVSFHYISSPLEAGFPEALDTWFVYTIHKNESVIDLNISATTTGPTIIDLSTHPFFNLGEETVLEQKLTIPASKMGRYAPGGSQVVIGENDVTQNEWKAWDFRNGKKIGQDINEALSRDLDSGGYDHIWKFDQTTDNLHTIKLENTNNNLKLEVTTDADAMIMYANCFEKDQLMNDGIKDTRYGAITIEPYKFFKASTITDDIYYDRDDVFNRYISYKISG